MIDPAAGPWDAFESAMLNVSALRRTEFVVCGEVREALIPYQREALDAVIGTATALRDCLQTALASDVANQTGEPHEHLCTA